MATSKQLRAQIERVRRAQQLADSACHRALKAGPATQSDKYQRYAAWLERFEAELDTLAEMIGAAPRGDE